MIAQRAANIVGLEVSEVWTAGKQRKIIQAGSILCYWAVRVLGETMSSMARRLNQGKRRIPGSVVLRRYAGTSDLTTLASEILELSKMDWNS